MQGGKNLVTQQVGELAIGISGVYPRGFGDLGSRAGKDGAWISKDMPAYGFTGFIGGRCVEDAERGKLWEADVNADFFCNLASSGLQWGLASLELAARQLEFGGRIFAHGEDVAKGITENYGGNFNHGPTITRCGGLIQNAGCPLALHLGKRCFYLLLIQADIGSAGGYGVTGEHGQ